MLFGIFTPTKPKRPEKPAISLDDAKAIIAAELERRAWQTWNTFSHRLESESGRLVWRAHGGKLGYRGSVLVVHVDAQTGKLLKFEVTGR